MSEDRPKYPYMTRSEAAFLAVVTLLAIIVAGTVLLNEHEQLAEGGTPVAILYSNGTYRYLDEPGIYSLSIACKPLSERSYGGV